MLIESFARAIVAMATVLSGCARKPTMNDQLAPDDAQRAIVEMLNDPTLGGYVTNATPAFQCLLAIRSEEAIKNATGPITAAPLESENIIYIGHIRCDTAEHSFSRSFAYDGYFEKVEGRFYKDVSGTWKAKVVGMANGSTRGSTGMK